jgi:hypothetical protein
MRLPAWCVRWNVRRVTIKRHKKLAGHARHFSDTSFFLPDELVTSDAVAHPALYQSN